MFLSDEGTNEWEEVSLLSVPVMPASGRDYYSHWNSCRPWLSLVTLKDSFPVTMKPMYISRESETVHKYQFSQSKSWQVNQNQGLLADAIVNNFQIDQVVWQAILPITLTPVFSQCFCMCSQQCLLSEVLHRTVLLSTSLDVAGLLYLNDPIRHQWCALLLCKFHVNSLPSKRNLLGTQ